MLKGAWILPVVMLVAILLVALAPAASSAADDEFRRSRPTAFKDLPGVVPEEDRVAQPSYNCTSELADVYIGRGRRYDMLYGDTQPRWVYRCKTDSGVTYTGTDLPNTQWVPGLNPHHLPK